MLEEIINVLDRNEELQSFIEQRVQDIYDYYTSYYLEEWEEADFSSDIEEFFTGYKAVEALSTEDFNLLKRAINKNIFDRAVAKKMADSYSSEYASNPENVAYHNGSRSKAYEAAFDEQYGAVPRTIFSSYEEVKGNQK